MAKAKKTDNDVMLGFVPVDEIPPSYPRNNTSRYDAMFQAFLDSGDDVLLKECEDEKHARSLTTSLNTRIRKTGLQDKLKARSRKNGCYLVRL